MTTFARAAAVAAALVLALVLPASAGVERPMSGRFIGSAIPADQRCGPGALTLGFALSGTLAHLGLVTGEGTNCTEFTLGTSAVDSWDGRVVLEAADGSKLATAYEGGQAAPVAGVATFAHRHTVTGGTGRFAGATGELSVSGAIDFASLTISGKVTGWVGY